jgi:hypothetical protein
MFNVWHGEELGYNDYMFNVWHGEELGYRDLCYLYSYQGNYWQYGATSVYIIIELVWIFRI